MRINENACVSTQKLVLVPYAAHHVPKYHAWMKDPDIQEATASEPLILEEEYAMQRTWRNDGDKLTFIICRHFKLPSSMNPNAVESHDDTRDRPLHDELDAMIGDVNLFISVLPDEGEDETSSIPTSPLITGELELMIAIPSHRRQGHGKHALLLFLTYILRNEGAILSEFHGHSATSATATTAQFTYFSAKIGVANHGSLALFEGLGFTKTREVPSWFGEWEVRIERKGVDKLVMDGDVVFGRYRDAGS